MHTPILRQLLETATHVSTTGSKKTKNKMECNMPQIRTIAIIFMITIKNKIINMRTDELKLKSSRTLPIESEEQNNSW